MKKENKTNETNKEVFNKGELKFLTLDEILSKKHVTEKGNMVQYPLQTGVTLTIIDTDNDYDFGSLNLFGLSINMTFRSTKNGMMAFYPSYKKSNGEYTNLVTSYSKSLNEIIKSVVSAHYNN